MSERAPPVSLGSLQLQVAEIRAISNELASQQQEGEERQQQTISSMASLSSTNHQATSTERGDSLNLNTATMLTKVTLLENSLPTAPETSSTTTDATSRDALDSPKRSIFDGASKDEILTYLEDARERVPELLMAADEVMVIGDNELLLVNQLEPGSPATPIAIVESDDIMSSSGDILAVEDDKRRRVAIQQPCPASSSVVLVESCLPGLMESRSLDDQMRLFDLEIKGLSLGNPGMGSRQPERDSLESSRLPSLEEHRPRNQHHNQLALMSLPAQGAANCPAGFANQPLDNQKHELTTTTTTTITATRLEETQVEQNADSSASALTAAATTASCQLFRPSLSSISDSSNKDQDESPSSDTHLCISERVTSMLRRTARRKSTSENSTESADTKRAVRMMMLQQCHSKTHDSISTSSSSTNSSSSSTPASCSSSSGSRSSSSNHTSGNCSGTSNFYTSPSLSCSSPFLGGLSQTVPASSTSGHQRVPQHQLPAQQPPLQNHSAAFSGDLALLSTSSFGHTVTGTGKATAATTPTRSQLDLVASKHGSSLECGAANLSQTMLSVQSSAEQNSDSGLEPENSSMRLTLRVNSSVSKELDRLTGKMTGSSGEAKIGELAMVARVSTSVAQPLVQTQTQASARLDERSQLALGATRSPDTTKLNVINEHSKSMSQKAVNSMFNPLPTCDRIAASSSKPGSNLMLGKEFTFSPSSGSSSSKLGGTSGGPSRPTTSHYATINRLNNYLVNRYRSSSAGSPEATPMVEFQCLDCDQFIVTDHARVLHKANELRLLRENEIESLENLDGGRQLMSLDQIDRAYVVALNGLPLCHYCEKKRTERKEIISEFLETELKYGQDLKIIHDEFYRPMQIAGLLNKDQINGIFSNLDELIMAHCRFAERLQAASVQAQAIGDTDYNTVNIGKLFVESADMLHTFESYCIRQAAAACLLARLAKEKELLRIFLRVSQMENTLLRRMNLAAFLMVPVQRVTKYPLLLNRLYKVTAYHHKDREALRDAQLKVELHLEHINQQTKGISATNKIWRRISNLSGQTGTGGGGSGSGGTSSKRGLISAEDIGYIKLRKTAMELLKWDRDETQFIHSGKIHFAPLNEYLVKQKMKSIRYMSAHALLIVLGKPNWKYRPDLVKSHLDYKLLTPTPGGNGIREAALLLFREKNGRFIPCREPLFLINCVLSNDCSQFNIETSTHSSSSSKQHQLTGSSTSKDSPSQSSSSLIVGSATIAATSGFSSAVQSSLMSRRSSPSTSGLVKTNQLNEFRAASADMQPETVNTSQLNAANSSTTSKQSAPMLLARQGQSRIEASIEARAMQFKSFSTSKESDASEKAADSISMSSQKSLPEERTRNSRQTSSPPLPQAARSYSLASAFSHTTSSTGGGSTSSSASLNVTKPHHGSSSGTSTSSNLNLLNPFKSKASNTANHQLNAATLLNSNKSQLTNSHAIDLGSTSQSVKSATPSTSSGESNLLAQLQDHSSSLNIKPPVPNGRVVNSSVATPMQHQSEQQHHLYNHHIFHNHHQPYGDYEESFEIHERLTKESLLLRADTPLKTRYWLQMLRYHAKDLGHWRQRRFALANIMMMRQE